MLIYSLIKLNPLTYYENYFYISKNNQNDGYNEYSQKRDKFVIIFDRVWLIIRIEQVIIWSFVGNTDLPKSKIHVVVNPHRIEMTIEQMACLLVAFFIIIFFMFLTTLYLYRINISISYKSFISYIYLIHEIEVKI